VSPGDAVSQLAVLFRKTFPERQIYIRSAGNIQFFTFGPSLQATLAIFCLIFLGWASFATVMVVFKDRNIAARDDRYDETRAAYDGRLASLGAAHDDLAAALARARQQFAALTEELINKQKAIGDLIARESRGEQTLGVSSAAIPGSAELFAETDDGVTPAFTLSRQASLALEYKDDGLSPTLPDAPMAAVRAALSRGRQLVASLFIRGSSSPPGGADPQNPALGAIADQVQRVRLLDRQDIQLVGDTGHLFDQRAGNLQELIRRTGINPQQFIRKMAGVEAMGGPEISLGEVRIAGIADTDFTHAYLRAAAVLAQLNLLSEAIGHIPLAMPVNGAHFDPTSGFGPRLDPFTGRYAFHPGLDFGGPWGAPVDATSSGIVVFAGERGSYGVTVEIDHGMGLHTRYAHLSATTVRAGSWVSRATVIGKVGSTGRSTGPHVHYEVWYDNVVRNPALFIGAGGRTISSAGVRKQLPIGNDKD
jgi:murein DD-endopeptidase MepM/ murein hydrolase activator NlpD